MLQKPIRISIFNENLHDKEEATRRVYPDGIHGALAACFTEPSGAGSDHCCGAPFAAPRIALQDMPECGLSDELLENTDVLFWWSHLLNGRVPDEIAEKVCRQISRGMGLVVLHSGHLSKVFRRLMGTSCGLKWRESDDFQRIFVIDPAHPIAAGLPEFFELPAEETYAEHFDIPSPDRVVFTSWYSGGEVFRSGCCFSRGKGRIFFFGPGHETYPTYRGAEVKKVLRNAARWAAPSPF